MGGVVEAFEFVVSVFGADFSSVVFSWVEFACFGAYGEVFGEVEPYAVFGGGEVCGEFLVGVLGWGVCSVGWCE